MSAKYTNNVGRITQDERGREAHERELNSPAGWFMLLSSGCPFPQAAYPADAEEEFKANCDLIAEAFNVATETGNTPRQLKDRLADMSVAFLSADNQRAALLVALQQIADDFVPSRMSEEGQALDEMRQCARAAIAKATNPIRESGTRPTGDSGGLSPHSGSTAPVGRDDSEVGAP